MNVHSAIVLPPWSSCRNGASRAGLWTSDAVSEEGIFAERLGGGIG